MLSARAKPETKETSSLFKLNPWKREVKKAMRDGVNITGTYHALLHLNRHLEAEHHEIHCGSKRFDLVKETILSIGLHPNPASFFEGTLHIKQNAKNLGSHLFASIRKALQDTLYPMHLALVIVNAAKAGLLLTSNMHSNDNFEKLTAITLFCFTQPELKHLLTTLPEQKYTQVMLNLLVDIIDQNKSLRIIQDELHIKLQEMIVSAHVLQRPNTAVATAATPIGTAESCRFFSQTPSGEEKAIKLEGSEVDLSEYDIIDRAETKV